MNRAVSILSILVLFELSFCSESKIQEKRVQFSEIKDLNNVFDSQLLEDSIFLDKRWNGVASAEFNNFRWRGNPKLDSVDTKLGMGKGKLSIYDALIASRCIYILGLPLKNGYFSLPNDSISVNLNLATFDDIAKPGDSSLTKLFRLSKNRKSAIEVIGFDQNSKTLKLRFQLSFDGKYKTATNELRDTSYQFTNGLVYTRISGDKAVVIPDL